MKILVVNGSPKGEKSNTMKLTEAFLEGLTSKTEAEIDILNINKLKIKPCLGCFGCWRSTPGKCVIPDDMAAVIEKELAADVIIWSFPLYYFGLPSQMKAMLDRHLPMNLPYMSGEDKGSGAHIARYDMSAKRYVFISSCGFYTAEGNYDSLNILFDRCFGKGHYETIYTGQGELFRVPELKGKTDEYLDFVRTAGSEFALGSISQETKDELSALLFPRAIFEKMSDSSWDAPKKA